MSGVYNAPHPQEKVRISALDPGLWIRRVGYTGHGKTLEFARVIYAYDDRSILIEDAMNTRMMISLGEVWSIVREA